MKFTLPSSLISGLSVCFFLSLNSCVTPDYEIREDFLNEEEVEHHEKQGQEMMDKLLKQAEKGNTTAMLELGVSFYSGRLFKQDFDKALFWFNRGAEKSNGECFYNLGLMYYQGDGVVKDDEKAYDYFSRSADAGVPLAYINAAVLAEKMNFPAEARIYYKLAVSANNDESQRAMKRLAFFYETGLGGERSYEKAIKHYTATAQNGDADSQMRLANAYNEGKIVEKDYELSMYWLKLAAESHPEAQTKMGYCYEKGFGVAKDYNLAIKWYRLAAQQNYGQAQIALGYCYSVGSGVAADHKEAFRWYSLAAQNNSPSGMHQVAKAYEEGRGIERNPVFAIKFYKDAVARNYPPALYRLGKLLQKGSKYLAKDEKKAFLYFQKSADHHPEAYYELAMCYLEGRGIGKNLERGNTLIKRAASRGSVSAETYLITKEFERRQRPRL